MMTLAEFLRNIKEQIQGELADPGAVHSFEENVFTDIVSKHLADIGMTYDPRVCHYAARISNADVKISAYSISDDGEELDLFVTIYSGAEDLEKIADSDTERAASSCLRFLAKCAEGTLATTMDQSNDAFLLALTIQEGFSKILEVKIFILTDRIAKSKSFKAKEISGKTIKLEVMDIERLWRHWSEGKPRDELVVNFLELINHGLPCIYVPSETAEYDYALTVLPGEILRYLYEKFGPRLLEANVRSFLSTTGKVNRGIRDTIRADPEKFLAFNNGIVVVADEAHIDKGTDGGPKLNWLKGMQIVNGGQTTASIYFTRKRYAEADLRLVSVPTKIIILHKSNPEAEEKLISDISRFANSQNSVKQSDLHANHPFHIAIERLSSSCYCPDGVGRWFYERAAGSYSTLLAREGSTPARLRQLRLSIPTNRKISKTDLAKYLNCWGQRPDLVSLGSQKNFDDFMRGLSATTEDNSFAPPKIDDWKRIVAKAILFKEGQKIVRNLVPAFQANVNAYTIALISLRAPKSIDFEDIWLKQAVNDVVRRQIHIWAAEVNKVLQASANGRMLSEWAKRPECWESVKAHLFSKPIL